VWLFGVGADSGPLRDSSPTDWPWFLDPADQEVPGSATVEWLGDAFVVFRWTMAGDVGKATSEMVLVLGRSDAHDAFTALYHDERGVCRGYAMTFDGSHWSMSREDPDMFQRFTQ